MALTTTTVSASGSVTHKLVPVASDPRIDCFYLYPSVSVQKRGNSTPTVEPQEKTAAVVQAAEFSRVCRVFAPMYRQVTEYGHDDPYHGNSAFEYDDVLAAWRDYMAHYNDGRGVVLIGHSEGSFLFKDLIQRQIEGTPEQKLLVSAILLGGNVIVKDGSGEGGDFSSVPACTSRTETGCVVAYSTWGHTPPADANFEDVSYPSSQHVLCVNPAAPGSNAAVPITPIFVGEVPEGIVPLTSVSRQGPVRRLPRSLHGPLRPAGNTRLAAHHSHPPCGRPASDRPADPPTILGASRSRREYRAREPRQPRRLGAAGPGSPTGSPSMAFEGMAFTRCDSCKRRIRVSHPQLAAVGSGSVPPRREATVATLSGVYRCPLCGTAQHLPQRRAPLGAVRAARSSARATTRRRSSIRRWRCPGRGERRQRQSSLSGAEMNVGRDAPGSTICAARSADRA